MTRLFSVSYLHGDSAKNTQKAYSLDALCNELPELVGEHLRDGNNVLQITRHPGYGPATRVIKLLDIAKQQSKDSGLPEAFWKNQRDCTGKDLLHDAGGHECQGYLISCLDALIGWVISARQEGRVEKATDAQLQFVQHYAMRLYAHLLYPQRLIAECSRVDYRKTRAADYYDLSPSGKDDRTPRTLFWLPSDRSQGDVYRRVNDVAKLPTDHGRPDSAAGNSAVYAARHAIECIAEFSPSVAAEHSLEVTWQSKYL